MKTALPPEEAQPESRQRTPSHRGRVPRWKRWLDVTVILLTAPVWATLMAGIAWWIKLVSRGPVLFKQERVGLGGARFVCLKFRTMHAGCATRAHEDHVRELMRSNRPMLKLDGKDSRLIPVASLLRATGLDELPQLFNVLRGEMSLVGPRPCTLQEYAEYSAPQRARLQVLPGLTGLWQVSGKNRTTFKEMIELDLRYVRLSCLWLDIEILRRTPVVLLTQVWEALRRRRNRGTPRAARRMNEAQAARATQFAERTRSHECRNN